MNTKQEFQQAVTDKYLGSTDFNGLPVQEFNKDNRFTKQQIRQMLISSINEDKIGLNFDINPHIKRLPLLPKEEQIKKLNETQIEHIVAYPSTSFLKQIVDVAHYREQPFTLRLALGEPQLTSVSFDLRVLEYYRNDPRYYYTTNDITGNISYMISNEPHLAEPDQILLDKFGFAYNAEKHRAVAVFLRYLSILTPEHQQRWSTNLLGGDYKMHPDYYKAAIIGEWHQGITILSAFIEELYQVNCLCKLMEYPLLFKKEFRAENKPHEFTFLIRPTLKEFNSFIHILDKMISENINKDFFRGEMLLEREETRKDGKTIVIPKGTIALLEEWLELNFKTSDESTANDVKKITQGFKKVRKLRQKPAHTISEDVFDQQYFLKQRELMIEVYESVLILRKIFQLHPKCKNYEVPNWLETGMIYTE